MRLIIPIILGLLGALVGLLLCKLFVRSWLAYPAAAVIGAVSAFAGMILRDSLDMTLVTSDPLFDMLLAGLLMSFVVSLVANIITSIVTRGSEKNTHNH